MAFVELPDERPLSAAGTSAVVDVEAELIALYPDLARRLTLILRNAHDAQDIAQAEAEAMWQ